MKQLLAFIALLAIGLFGCSTPSGGQPESTGKVNGAITVGTGVTLTSLTYSIGNGGTPITGSITLGPTIVDFQVGDIPDGLNYTVTLSGTDNKGFTCFGEATGITVSTDVTTSCTIAIVCGGDAGVGLTESDAGALAINATVSIDGGFSSYCSSLQGISVANADLARAATEAFNVYEMGLAPLSFTYTAGPACSPLFEAPTCTGGNCAGTLWCPGGTGCATPYDGFYTLTATVSQGVNDPCNEMPYQTTSVTVYCE